MFRRAAEKWIKAIDHQLQLAGLPGLSLFEVSGEQEAPQHWSRWRHLSIGMDMGSDGLAAANFLQRELKLVLDITPDPSHLLWRGVQAALKSAGLYGFALPAFNLPHGPWSEDVRYVQVKVALDNVLAHENPSTCPLFSELLGCMEIDCQESLHPTDIRPRNCGHI